GYRFVAEHCNYAFITGDSVEETKAASLKAKALVEEVGRPVRTQANVILILGETEDAARAMYQDYVVGADRDAIDNVFHLRARDRTAERVANMKDRYESEDRIIYGGLTCVGGPEHTAEFFEDLAVNGAVDGIVMAFQDFLVGLRTFGDKVMPLLRRRGIEVGLPESGMR